MVVFWERGYEGTSMTELTRAMGINAPSLYATFKSKEELFRETIELYERTEGEAPRRALTKESKAKDAVAGLLRESVVAYTTEGKPSGCMIVQAAANCTTDHETVRNYALRCRKRTESAIRERLEQAVAEGDLQEDIEIGELAAFYATVLHGLSVQARDGAPRNRLFAVVDTAVSAWPS
jgi:AcrR family transcriptional regulator